MCVYMYTLQYTFVPKVLPETATMPQGMAKPSVIISIH